MYPELPCKLRKTITAYALLKYFENLHIFLRFNFYEVNFRNDCRSNNPQRVANKSCLLELTPYFCSASGSREKKLKATTKMKAQQSVLGYWHGYRQQNVAMNISPDAACGTCTCGSRRLLRLYVNHALEVRRCGASFSSSQRQYDYTEYKY